MPAERPAQPAVEEPVDPQQVLRDARAKFVAAFPSQSAQLASLVTRAATGDAAAAIDLRRAVHRLAGFAGTVGFPTVSARASELEDLLDAGARTFDAALARDMADATREAFTLDLSRPPAWTSPAHPKADRPLVVLVIEDNQDQADVLCSHLAAAGHRPLLVASGDRALAAARTERPDLVLLDIELPGLDGYSVCRLLKADPSLGSTPVVFMTTRSGLDDRLAGLTLGADEFLTKPIDMRELLLRVHLLGARAIVSPGRSAAATAPPSVSGVLAYKDFLEAARTQVALTPAAVALVRVPIGQSGAAASALLEELRRRDIEGWYNAAHLLVLLPALDAAGARDLLAGAIRRLASSGIAPLHAGVTSSPAPGSVAPETLVAEADEALALARAADLPAAVRSDRAEAPARRRRVVIAEDDPEVVRIIDAQLRQAGFDTTIAFDGERAVEAVTARQADVLLLDLMLPRQSGFEVLAALRRLEARPRVVVLSAREHDEDVARAFDLGADDYLTKPFSPQELRARISRLLR
jgi:DNA-binding response OmpR family regulator